MNIATFEEVHARLSAYINGYKTQTDAARSMKVSQQYLSRVLKREQPPSAKILSALGYDRRVVYAQRGTHQEGGNE